MHSAWSFPVHFPLRRLDRDAPTKEMLAPEHRHPDGLVPFRQILYRAYDSARNPLYIGISGNGGHRLDDHRKRSAWWPLAEYIAISVYGTAETVKEAERAALRHEQPPFNRQSVRGRANVRLALHGTPEAAAVQLFREATPEFIAELSALLAQPERFPQPSPPPPARFTEGATP